MKSLHKVVYLVLISMISFSFSNLMASDAVIEIDQTSRQLIAPEGMSYQWYLNGELIIGNEQKINVANSGTYRVEVADEMGNITSSDISVSVTADGIRKIYIIGDSTVQTYSSSKYPFMGWGQVLQQFFDDSKVQTVNHSIGGRSSRSFWEEGRWTTVKNLLAADDYVFIQFGHNDRDTKPERYTDTAAFKDYMRIYVNESREKGAIPVLISPMVMNAWSGATMRNVFTEGSNDYRGAMYEVAEELDVAFVDLNMKSWNFMKQFNWDYNARMFNMYLNPGEYPNYPDGYTDGGTHYQEMGALTMSSLIMEGINELAADDDDMSYLSVAQTPSASVEVKLSSPDAGSATYGGSFPIGSKITIKTILKEGRVFDHWEDAAGSTISTDNLVMFTLGESVSYTAIVDDCNGDLGGDASYDNCNFCSGGNTGVIPCEVKFESEEACSYTGRINTKTFADDSRRVINTGGLTDSLGIEYSVEATEAGTYGFKFVYNSGIEGEQLNIYVNGTEAVSGIDLLQSSGWNHVEFQLDLRNGVNSIIINSTATEGRILFDFLAAYSSNLLEGDCDALGYSLEYADQDALVYPNPFNESLNIQTEGTFVYRVYNTAGMELLNGSAESSCGFGSELSEGMYLLQIIKGSNKYTRIIHKQ